MQPERCLFSHLQLILLLPLCAPAQPPVPLPPCLWPRTPFQPSGAPPTSAHSRGLHFSPLGSPQHCQAFSSLAFLIPREPGLPLSSPHALLWARMGQAARSHPAAPGLGLQSPGSVLKMCSQVLLETQEDFICRYIKITLAGVGNRCQRLDILSYLFPSSTLWKAEYVTPYCNKGLVLVTKIRRGNVQEFNKSLQC